MLKELGLYKQRILAPLYDSDNIKDILIGSRYQELSDEEVTDTLKKHIFSSLFVGSTITETSTYIFMDVFVPRMNKTIKSCKIVMYAFCHKDIINDYNRKGYYGNRPDILCQMIEEVLCNESVARNFGIGKLELNDVNLYNDERKFYGKILEFSVPNFR